MMAYAEPEHLRRLRQARDARARKLWCQLFSEARRRGIRRLAGIPAPREARRRGLGDQGQKVGNSARITASGIVITRTDPNVPKARAGLTMFSLSMKDAGRGCGGDQADCRAAANSTKWFLNRTCASPTGQAAGARSANGLEGCPITLMNREAWRVGLRRRARWVERADGAGARH